MGYLRKKILLDLDGTLLAFDQWRDPWTFGAPIPGAECFLSVAYALGHRTLLWTTRTRSQVRRYLAVAKRDGGLRNWSLLKYLDDVNQIPHDWQPTEADTGPKPYYDLSLDDRTLNGHALVTQRFPAQFTPLTWGLVTVRLLREVDTYQWLGFQEGNWMENIRTALDRLIAVGDDYALRNRRMTLPLRRMNRGKFINTPDAVTLDDSGLERRLHFSGMMQFLREERRRVTRALRGQAAA